MNEQREVLTYQSSSAEESNKIISKQFNMAVGNFLNNPSTRVSKRDYRFTGEEDGYYIDYDQFYDVPSSVESGCDQISMINLEQQGYDIEQLEARYDINRGDVINFGINRHAGYAVDAVGDRKPVEVITFDFDKGFDTDSDLESKRLFKTRLAELLDPYGKEEISSTCTYFLIDKSTGTVTVEYMVDDPDLIGEIDTTEIKRLKEELFSSDEEYIGFFVDAISVYEEYGKEGLVDYLHFVDEKIASSK